MQKKSFNIGYLLFFIMGIFIALGLYRCPIKYIFGMSCPICGLTRALACALKLNFKGAFHYYLFWPLIIIGLVLHILYEYKKININKKLMFGFLYSFCAINLVYYFYRFFSGSSIVYFDFSESLLYRIYKAIFHV